jgi:8-oxo-dGTP pyrophosphatase MutT (NUDIX family)
MMTMDLSATDQVFLKGLLERAQQPRPEAWVPWYLRGIAEPLGWMAPERAQCMSLNLPTDLPLVLESRGWVWQADQAGSDDRSRALQALAFRLRAQGEVVGWRDEPYACWGCPTEDWPYTRPELFRLERAAFRYFGLRSHASHVHGIRSDGRMWCGRRAMSKATDPGLLDNLAAGGLPAGEDPLHCAVREMWEEAGLVRQTGDLLPLMSSVLTERQVPEGWHSERLFVWTLPMGMNDQPINQDGEVSEFLTLDWPQVLQHLKAEAFTPDAACAIAATLAGGLFDGPVHTAN